MNTLDRIAYLNNFSEHEKFGCLMLDCNKVWSEKDFRIDGYQMQIDHDDLVKDGLIYDRHITICYGFANEWDIVAAYNAANDIGPIMFKLSMIKRFENIDHDVIVAEVQSPQLIKLNSIIKDTCSIKSIYPTYDPHLTLAYVKKGASRNLDGSVIDMQGISEHLKFQSADNSRIYHMKVRPWI